MYMFGEPHCLTISYSSLSSGRSSMSAGEGREPHVKLEKRCAIAPR